MLVQMHLRLPDRPDALDTLTRAVSRSGGEIVRTDVVAAPVVRQRVPPDGRPRAAVMKLSRRTSPEDGDSWQVMADGVHIGTVRAHDDDRRRTRQWTASLRDGRTIPGVQRTRRDAATQLLIEYELSA